MSWVRPDLPHTPANAQLDAVIVVNSRKLSRKYRTNRVLNPGPMVCESSTLSARPQRLPHDDDDDDDDVVVFVIFLYFLQNEDYNKKIHKNNKDNNEQIILKRDEKQT